MDNIALFGINSATYDFSASNGFSAIKQNLLNYNGKALLQLFTYKRLQTPSKQLQQFSQLFHQINANFFR